MSTSTVNVNVLSRSGRAMGTFNVNRSLTVDDFKKKFQLTNPKYPVERQYFTIGVDKDRKVLARGKPLSEYIPASSSSVEFVFKDLGLQIGWRTVFYIEYFGPILVHSLLFFFPHWFYSIPNGFTHSFTQRMAFGCVLFHYLKREYETHFIHRFSSDTMPFTNVFKNSFHYWILGGLSIAYFVYHPLYTSHFSDAFVSLCCGLFGLFEMGNLYSHIILRDLRKAGTRERGIPRGFLFEYVTCANYTFEIWAWAVYTVFTWNVSALFFLIVSTVQIAMWSLKKHVALKKEFGTKVPRRNILFPFVW